jgi:menaquinone-dependent protoporphyrinogen oxidase
MKKTLIAYSTKYGSVKKCAEILKGYLNTETDILEVKRNYDVDLNNYDTVIIGGSIHRGKVQKEIKAFTEKLLQTLKQKNIGLFVCSMGGEKSALRYIKRCFPDELNKKALVKGGFGGEYVFERMDKEDIEDLKRVIKVNQNIYNISEEKIREFAEIMNQSN